MAKATFRVEGFKELERALVEELPKATARNVLWRTAEGAMKRLEEREKSLAPIDPQDRDGDGRHLNETIKTERVKATRSRGSTRFSARNGVEVRTGPAPVGKRARANAGWQELGTTKMAANSYIRPAIDVEAENIIDDVRSELTIQIGKARARIARKAAKGR